MARKAASATGENPFRFAVVGFGQISQQAFVPGLAQLPGAQLKAVVTGSVEKETALSKAGIDTYSYEEYLALLQRDDIDGVYIATPIFHHRDHSIAALEAGKPVLLEKPMADSVSAAEDILSAVQRTGTPLMVAYRMHQDAFMVELVQLIKSGKIGEPRIFSSVFSHDIKEENHRGHSGFWGGPVPDFGAYPLNLVRHLFRAEPCKVQALGITSDDRNFNFEDGVAVNLEFPEGKLAQYILSYNAADHDYFSIVGSRGVLSSDSCFSYSPDSPRRYHLESEEQPEKSVDYQAQVVDQFAGETQYFIDCVRGAAEIEPNAEEGLADIRVCAAIEQSLRSGETISLPRREFRRELEPDQVRCIEPLSEDQVPEDEDLVDQVAQDR
ncbi:gfo/Idh/MocA family oxidoreductase [Corynebacterium poyangense]|uniref:Gfo/Idh/MocA family oxidoreductase n=2 Tax=Corynebacterium poyangense TaxID=2684405 RepID=A0A7H0SS36_9CORY|nr:Gfo/Idh/MocA family oxidoreductase [Corynebacterium poyangense]QNQ91361.1 gfo/Idh/MocA family oxidoreductase [Corynebacterium poyangense]